MRKSVQKRWLARATARVLTQGKRAYAGSKCQYRIHVAGENLCCAIGGLIKDPFYKPEMESDTLKSVLPAVFASNVDLTALDSITGDDDIPQEVVELFAAIQRAHDECESPERFQADFLAKIAAVSRQIDEGVFIRSIGHQLLANCTYSFPFDPKILRAELDTSYGKSVMELVDRSISLLDALENKAAREKVLDAVAFEALSLYSEGPF